MYGLVFLIIVELLRMMNKQMTQHTTIADVAKAAGVSATTVSRIINGRYDKMRPSTRKRVEKAIKDLQFLPTASARQLRQTHSHVVGIIVEIFLTPFHLYSPKGSMMFYNRQAMISSS